MCKYSFAVGTCSFFGTCRHSQYKDLQVRLKMDAYDDIMITVIVKTPNLDVKDQQYECNKNWTVKSLKVFLSDAYPTKPSVENQRLIYFGHLLSDSALLREVLNVNSSKTHTIHLVCPPSQNNSTVNDSMKQNEARPAEVVDISPTETITQQSSHSIAQGGAMGHYLRNSDPRNNLPTFPVPSFYPGFAGNVDFAQHAALMQQMYMQYMAQYFQYEEGFWVHLYPSFGFLVPYHEAERRVQTYLKAFFTNAQSMGMYISEPNQPVPATETPASSQSEPEVQVRTTPPENHNRLVQNEPPENQNRPVQNEEGPAPNRDILDVIYILSRFTVLLSVIYFYSSLGRCLFVIGLGCLIYIYRGGIFCFRRERHRNEARHHIAHPRRNASRHEPAAGRNRRATHTQPVNTNEARHRRNGQVTAVKAFVTSFFSSLIPDQHHPVNVN